MITEADITDILRLAKQHPVLDVRSPGEYGHGHIPGAYNLPLFTDEERKIVGTLYKQQGREDAIKTGLDYYGPKMRQIVEQAETICDQKKAEETNSKTVIVHCWRGGMRSQAIAWLLDLYGFKVHLLKGGYKTYRNHIIAQFSTPRSLCVLGGYSGAGKTVALHHLQASENAVIDLEELAGHKGSAFGALHSLSQPSQEMFENLLGKALYDTAANLPGKMIWVEDESRRIGAVHLPDGFWKMLQSSPVYFLDVPFEKRLDHITAEYSAYGKTELEDAIMRIQKRLGGLNSKNAINYLRDDNYTECFRILLRYYDKYYSISLYDRKMIEGQFHSISWDGEDPVENCRRLLKKQTQ